MQQSMINYSGLQQHVKNWRKTVCTSQRLYKDKRMCVSSEVICAMFERKGYIWKVNEPMNNLVQMARFKKFSPFRKWGYVPCHYRNYPILWYIPYMQNVEQIRVLYVIRQVRIPDSSCIFKMRMDDCHIWSLQSLHNRVSAFQFAVGLWTEWIYVRWLGQIGC